MLTDTLNMESLRIEEGSLLRRFERFKGCLSGSKSDKWTKVEIYALLEAFVEQYSKLGKQTLNGRYWKYLA